MIAPLPLVPAAFGTDAHAVHTVPVTAAVEVREGHVHRDVTHVQRFVDEHVVSATTLRVRLGRHATPARDDLVAHLTAKLDHDARTHQRHDAVHAEFGRLHDRPLAAVTLQR